MVPPQAGGGLLCIPRDDLRAVARERLTIHSIPMFEYYGLPVQLDEDDPDNWVYWGVVGPRSVIETAAAELAATLDAVYGRSVRPRMPVTPVKHGLAMLSYSEDLLSTLEELDRASKSPEGGVSDGMFECRTLYEWLRRASKDSTIAHIHAFCRRDNSSGNASVWQKGDVIWRPWKGERSVAVVEYALRFLTDQDRVVPSPSDTTTFSSESNVVETASNGRVLEFIVRGAMSHDSWNSVDLTRRAARELNDEIARSGARAVVVNLLAFDYSFGNEIGELLLAPYMTLARSGGGRMAIVAAGQTAASLDSLLTAGHLDSLLGRTCPDMASALAHMTEIPPFTQERS